ncbi:MAG: family 43 glycosylhydrolase [Firmicutes bacterium]|nr:family 43 glycosylhydrolase [Bacillota bacterium]
MAKYYCNPVNINYHYQFNKDRRNGGALTINREAADPSMICYKDRYYVFASMNLSVWVSDDLVTWESYPLPADMPLYDYAPDVRVIKAPTRDENDNWKTEEWVYFCASRRNEKCDRYRTQDILNGPYEKIPGTFPYWDPNLFQDDDGRLYFYWGCSNMTPIYGVELDPFTMKPYGATLSNPMGNYKAVIEGDPFHKGFERVGDDHAHLPASDEEIEEKYQAFLKKQKIPAALLPQKLQPLIKGMFADKPYIEGAWMNKHEGKYYLQYACPGTQYNTYADAVYVSDNPMGPFELAPSNPFSYKPGGFLTGAGHGSTMEDRNDRLWHISTMRISMHHMFERRVGLWRGGYTKDGDLVCDTRYGDWPQRLPEGRASKALSDEELWQDPEWMLLSYKKEMTASSYMEGSDPQKAADEDVRTWWQASGNSRDEWLKLDLGKIMDVRAIQINFADGKLDIPVPGKMSTGDQPRYIDEHLQQTQWTLAGSVDGETFEIIEDKSCATTDLSHDLIVREEGLKIRYLRLYNMRVPYGQNPAVSGLRVFGLQEEDPVEKPKRAEYVLRRLDEIDMAVVIKLPEEENVTGYNILFGISEDKLYLSHMVMAGKLRAQSGVQKIGALIAGQEYFVRVDTFNEAGITHGIVQRCE